VTWQWISEIPSRKKQSHVERASLSRSSWVCVLLQPSVTVIVKAQ
jgi:hypothetical protein